MDAISYVVSKSLFGYVHCHIVHSFRDIPLVVDALNSCDDSAHVCTARASNRTYYVSVHRFWYRNVSLGRYVRTATIERVAKVVRFGSE
jgi:hypothetical protein